MFDIESEAHAGLTLIKSDLKSAQMHSLSSAVTSLRENIRCNRVSIDSRESKHISWPMPDINQYVQNRPAGTGPIP
jgi:hypothetical protein